MASKSSRVVFVVAAVCLAALASQAKQDKTGQAAAKVDKVASTRSIDPKLYAGTETCVGCHEEIGKIYEKGPHSKTEASQNAPAFAGCEGCHGPGKAHAEGGGDTSTIVSFKNLSRAESTRICLDCHQHNEHNANYLQSHHARSDVGCLDCHASHKARVQARLLKTSQPQLCYGCHQEAKPDSGKPSKAAKPAPPVPKPHNEFGAGQECTSCHSAIHGSNSSRTQSKF
jgi:predicted CXXCH cytochrome family protein